MKVVEMKKVVSGVTITLYCELRDEEYQRMGELAAEHPEMTTAELVDAVRG